MATTLGSTGITFPDATTQTTAAVAATGNLIGYNIYTTVGANTYTKATNNPSFIIVEVVGGGGGMSGAGGTSSFGAHCSATGGAMQGSTALAVAGTGTGGDLNLTGSKGMIQNGTGQQFTTVFVIANAGEAPFYSNSYGTGAGGYAGSSTGTPTTSSSGAGGGYSRKKILNATLAATTTATVGAAGATAGSTAATAGIIIVWEYR